MRLYIRVHGYLAKIQWNVIARYERILQQSDNRKHYRCWLRTREDNLGRFQNTKPEKLSWSIRTEWHTTIVWCIWTLPQQMHRNIWAWSCMLFVGTSITGMVKKDRSRIRVAGRCKFTTNATERHQRCNVSCHTSICKSQQQIHEGLWPRQRIFTSHVLAWQQLSWVGNATKVARGWFLMEKRLA